LTQRNVHPAFQGDMAASYDARNAPMTPLRDALQFLTARLFLQDLPQEARILCVGAGTGLEILYLAGIAPGWTFTAVDPSGDMLAVCRSRLAEAGLTDRCQVFQGYIDEFGQETRYDAATSILASHFITDRGERQRYFSEIAARLEPGAVLVNADLSGDRTTPAFPELEHAWLAALRATGMDDEGVTSYRENLDTSVGLLAPADLAELIASAGFTPPVQFYQGGLIHGHFARRA